MKTLLIPAGQAFAPYRAQARGEHNRAVLDQIENITEQRSICAECGTAVAHDSSCVTCERELEELVAKSTVRLTSWIASKRVQPIRRVKI